MTRLILTKVAVGAVLLLASCGPMAQGTPLRTIGSELRGVLTPSEEPQPAAAAAETEGATAEPAEAPAAPAAPHAGPGGAGSEAMLVSLPTRGVGARVASVGRNQDKITWFSPDGIGIVTRNGILIGTRGLGHDLMGADVASFDVIASGAANQRLIERLTGQDQIESLIFNCALTGQASEEIDIAGGKLMTTRYEEECRSSGYVFTNKYWTNESGDLVRSLQLVSPGVGYMIIQPI